MENFKVTYMENGLRLDKCLVKFLPDLTRSKIAKLIDAGNCHINNEVAKASYKVKTDDEISIDLTLEEHNDIQAEDIDLKIIYEDNDILIIDKPQGMVVHPSCGHHEHTLVNAIMNHCSSLSSINGDNRPGIVHRIDKDTSGLICVAKNDKAHVELANQLVDHTMSRTYMALVRGVIKESTGTIDMPIGRHPSNRQKMAVNQKDGKQAITHFRVIERFKEHSLIECNLVTGRTHQIRVHMSQIGYPVEGDPLYCGRNYDKLYKDGQLLTAIKLKLIHPATKKEMVFETSLPEYFTNIINELK